MTTPCYFSRYLRPQSNIDNQSLSVIKIAEKKKSTPRIHPEMAAFLMPTDNRPSIKLMSSLTVIV